MPNILINGEKKEINSDTSVSELISMLELDVEKIAIERNEEIVHLENYPKTILKNEDKIEIIHFVGGG
jgi:thiamine biosynthesis protein ThiS